MASHGSRRIGTSLSPAYYISRRSIKHGLFGNNRVWRAVFYMIMARRLFQKLSGSEPQLALGREAEAGPVRERHRHRRGDAAEEGAPSAVKVLLRNPRRTIEVSGGRTVSRLLDELGLNREAHLVIRNGTLVPGDDRLDDADTIEVRPVISGGSV